MVLSLVNDVLPFMVMVMIECGGVFNMTFSKKVMNNGMNNLVYVAYRNVLGTIILLPLFIFHRRRSQATLPSLSHLCKFFVLGLIGICLLQIFGVLGVKYSSPTLASATNNLDPAMTFFLAVVFRMERFDFRRPTSQLKLFGTITAISGALLMIFYKGPKFLIKTQPSTFPNEIVRTQNSNWVLGGVFLVVTCLLCSSWTIAQTAMIKQYPDETTIAFFSSMFGTIQCLIYSLVVVRDSSAWTLEPGIEITAIVYTSIFAIVVRIPAVTWCLRKKGPIFVAMFRPMQMVIAVIIGFILFGDALSLGSVIGGIMIAAGFYPVMRGAAKEKEIFENEVSDLESSCKTTLLKK